jgi:toxin YoeB
MRKISFTPVAYEDYLSWFDSDKKTFIKINILIIESAKSPFQGIGRCN